MTPTPYTAPGLTPCERAVLDGLADAWNVFVNLPSYHPDEADEMRRAIHAAQYLIARRVAVRVDPDIWAPPSK